MDWQHLSVVGSIAWAGSRTGQLIDTMCIRKNGASQPRMRKEIQYDRSTNAERTFLLVPAAFTVRSGGYDGTESD